MKARMIFSLMVLFITGCGSHSTVEPDRGPTLSDQRVCSDQASKYAEKNAEYSSYTSHYDSVARVCYIEGSRTSFEEGKRHRYSTIHDAFGGQEYGQFLIVSAEGEKKDPSMCSIHPRGKAVMSCNTEEDFDRLALQYFGTTAD
jgi:hypothetical protein